MSINRMDIPDDAFGLVAWVDDDVRDALAKVGLPATQENIDAIKDSVNDDIECAMVQTGWSVLDEAALELRDKQTSAGQ